MPKRTTEEYKKNKAEREARKLAYLTKYGKSIEELFTYETLYRASVKACTGSRWKQSIQNYEAKLFSNVEETLKHILNDTWEPAKPREFTLCERGKVREIEAPNIKDKGVYKILTKEVLLPLYQYNLHYNNGASQERKGMAFTFDKVKKYMREHFRKYGKNGHILLIDAVKFFPSASHEYILKRHEEYILDERVRELADKILLATTKDKGMPLGVEASQIEMVGYTTALDNYISCQLHLRTVHFMDDYIIFLPPGKDPHKIFQKIRRQAEKYAITLHEDYMALPFGKPFVFCKAKFFVSDTGKVYVHGNKKSFGKAKKKFRKFKELYDGGEMSLQDVWTSVNGSLAYFERYDEHNRVLALRKYFFSLFGFSCERYENFREQKTKELDSYILIGIGA